MYSFITYSLWVTDVTKKIEKTEEHITYILSFLEEFVKRVWVIVVKKHNEIGTVWRMEKKYSFVRPDQKAALSDDKFGTKTDGKIINMLWIIVLKPNL